MTSRPRRVTSAAALVLVVASACNFSVGFQVNNAKPQLNPTPAGAPVPDPVDDPRLARSLLEVDDLEALVGAPLGIEEMSTEEAGLTQNPDPRGPCGQTVDAAEPPPWDEAALSVFAWDDPPSGTLIHAIWEMPGDSAARLYAKFRRQYDPECPPWQSETPWGTQTVTVGPPLDVDTGRAEAFGYTMDFDVEGGGGAGALGVIRRGPRLAYVMVLSDAPLSTQFLADAIVEAARRL